MCQEIYKASNQYTGWLTGANFMAFEGLWGCLRQFMP